MPENSSHLEAEKIWIGSDHAGYSLKKGLLSLLPNQNCQDLGVFSEASADYPDVALRVGEAVLTQGGFGLLICGSGQGMAMSANRLRGIRAALCWNVASAELARAHNNANILCLGGRFLEVAEAREILAAFLKTPFEGGRHQNRLNKF